MRSPGGCTLSRAGRGFLALALASCAPQDPVAPKDGPGTSLARLEVSPHAPGEFFVSPTGSPSGDGSFIHPWDLATALESPPAVTPGSTIWLRGGTYTNGTHFGLGYVSHLSGTADAPIVVRQYPGERATVTKFLSVRGAHTWYWGFEVVHPAPHAGNAFGIENRAPGTKLINLVVHDASASGIFIFPEATDAEVYGSISYSNGRTDNFDHGIYCQSQSRNVLTDNIVFQNWALGIHCFSETGPFLQSIHLEGNIAFNNSVWGVPRPDILVGGEFPASGITVHQNYTYRTDPSDIKIADIGWDFMVGEDVVLTNDDVVLTDNYFVGGWIHVGAWATAIVTGNTLFNFANAGIVWNRGDLSRHSWSGNTFFGDPSAAAWRYGGATSPLTTFDGWRTLTGFADPGTYAGSAPTGVKIVVRANRYEPGRANIIVYNWDQESTVSVDVSEVLKPGDGYVVQHAQDFYGPPIASGVYTGGSLELPMVRITPPTPLGTSTAPAPVTGPTFNAFVLLTKPRPGRHPGFDVARTNAGRGPCRPVWRDGPASCTPGSSSRPR